LENQKLVEFVRSAKSHGAGDEFLVALLRQNGWSERRIYSAFSAYYLEATGLPVPIKGSRTENARDAFFYLLAFVTLGIWAIAFVWLGNILIDRAFPSPLDYHDYAIETFRSNVAGQLASLIVAFPIFILVSRRIVRETQQRPESLESGVRKWLTYLALVITAVALLGDGVWFLQQFLLGDLTLRFVLKSLVLFVVAGGVLWYYLGTVRPSAGTSSRDGIFGWAATGAVVLAIVLGFTGVGTPAYERSLSLDEQRVSDLRTIASAMTDTYRTTKRLPKILPDSQRAMVDPVTRKPYSYVPMSGSHYKLCTAFDAPSAESTDSPFWQHGSGESCYTFDALTSPG
jgi:hypothetical protein